MAFISQAKFYIDFSGGNFQLRQVESVDEDDDSDPEDLEAGSE